MLGRRDFIVAWPGAGCLRSAPGRAAAPAHRRDPRAGAAMVQLFTPDWRIRPRRERTRRHRRRRRDRRQRQVPVRGRLAEGCAAARSPRRCFTSTTSGASSISRAWTPTPRRRCTTNATSTSPCWTAARVVRRGRRGDRGGRLHVARPDGGRGGRPGGVDREPRRGAAADSRARPQKGRRDNDINHRIARRYFPAQQRYRAASDVLGRAAAVVDNEDWRSPRVVRYTPGNFPRRSSGCSRACRDDAHARRAEGW